MFFRELGKLRSRLDERGVFNWFYDAIGHIGATGEEYLFHELNVRKITFQFLVLIMPGVSVLDGVNAKLDVWNKN